MPDPVELRSDTTTHPTEAMRDAMRDAEVGNAAWDEDPTVNALQDRCAELFGKEAGMFVPSGTMGNQTAIRAHVARSGSPAPEVVLHERAHIYNNEAAGLSTLGHAQARPLPGEDGEIPLADLEAAIRPDKRLRPDTVLFCLENTHNYCGGVPLDLGYHAAVADLADDHGVAVHVDGARIFNAATALDVDIAEIAAHADTVQFCFSKALAAPIGSMLVGPEEVITDAFHARQAMGGAMRQAGHVAAAAQVSLDEMVDRLDEDHRRARELWQGLDDLPLDVTEPATNIVVIDTTPAGIGPDELAARCADEGVRFSVISDTEMRAVTHYEIGDEDVKRAVEVVRGVLG